MFYALRAGANGLTEVLKSAEKNYTIPAYFKGQIEEEVLAAILEDIKDGSLADAPKAYLYAENTDNGSGFSWQSHRFGDEYGSIQILLETYGYGVAQEERRYKTSIGLPQIDLILHVYKKDTPIAYELYKDILEKNPETQVTYFVDKLPFKVGAIYKLSLLHNIKNPLILAGYPNILEECYFDKHAKFLGITPALWDKYLEPLRQKYSQAFVKGEYIIDTEDTLVESEREELRNAISLAAKEAGHYSGTVDSFFGLKTRFKQFDEEGLPKKIAIELGKEYKGKTVEEMYRNRHAYDIIVKSPLTKKKIRVRLCGQSPVIRDDYKFVGYGPDTLTYFAAALKKSGVIIIQDSLPKELRTIVDKSKARVIRFDGTGFVVEK